MADCSIKTKIKMTDDYSQLQGPNLLKNNVPFFLYVAKLYLPSVIDDLLNDPHKKSITIGDYGACDGKTLMSVVDWIIDYVQQKGGKDFPVTIVYEDLPENDFTVILTNVDGPISLQKKYRNVKILTCDVGFYSQCVDDGTMDIILCNWGLHWLSTLPCNASTTLFPHMSKNETEMVAFSERAAKDWLLFLEKRSKEIRLNGVMLIGVNLNHDYKFYIDDAIDAAYKCLIDDEVLSANELERTTMPVYFRTLNEIRKPFRDPHSPVLKAGLRLKADYSLHKMYTDDDLEIFIDDNVYSAKVFTEHTLYSGMKGDASSKNKTLEMLYSILGEVIRKNEHATIGYGVQFIQKV